MAAVPSPRARARFLAALLLPLLILVACSAGDASPSATAFMPTIPPTVAPTAVAAAFPVTLTDDEGTAVTISSKPQKIVSLTASGRRALQRGRADRDRYTAALLVNCTPEELADLQRGAQLLRKVGEQ